MLPGKPEDKKCTLSLSSNTSKTFELVTSYVLFLLSARRLDQSFNKKPILVEMVNECLKLGLALVVFSLFLYLSLSLTEREGEGGEFREINCLTISFKRHIAMLPFPVVFMFVGVYTRGEIPSCTGKTFIFP